MDTLSTIQTWTVRGATLDDLPSVLEMFNLCSVKMVGEEEFNYEEYLNAWTSPTLNLAEDVKVAVTPDGKIVGVMEVWGRTPHIRNWVWGRTHPDYEGQGIGTALLHWAEERARLNEAKAETDLRVSIELGTYPYPAAETLIENEGFSHIRYAFTMERVLDALPETSVVPDGLVIRPMRVPQEYAAIHRADKEAFMDHWGNYPTPFEESFRDFMHYVSNPTHDPSLWFLAMDGDEIAGMVLSKMDDPQVGWIDTLAVRKPWRKQGVGLALLYYAFSEIHKRGQSKVQLDVDAENLTGALRLYYKAGMYIRKQFALYEKVLREGRDIQTR